MLCRISPKLIDVDGNRVSTDDKIKTDGHFRDGNVVGDNRTPTGAGQFGDGAWVSGSDLTQGRFPTQLFTNIKNDKFKYVKNIT